MPAVDESSGLQEALQAPANEAAAITPHDTNTLASVTRGIYVGGDGDLTVDMAATGTSVLFKAVKAGTILPIRATRVYDTGTDATYLVALW